MIFVVWYPKQPHYTNQFRQDKSPFKTKLSPSIDCCYPLYWAVMRERTYCSHTPAPKHLPWFITWVLTLSVLTILGLTLCQNSQLKPLPWSWIMWIYHLHHSPECCLIAIFELGIRWHAERVLKSVRRHGGWECAVYADGVYWGRFFCRIKLYDGVVLVLIDTEDGGKTAL